MEAGAIVEQGTHDELLAKQGAYAMLYEAQFAAPIAEEEPPALPVPVGAPPMAADIVRDELAEEGEAPLVE
jgi:ATP-binding cassette subfamily B protein